jgi:5-hydroxyisourate hydrolase
MAIISSHVLDSVIGDHARGIRIEFYRLDGDVRTQLFDRVADEQGRIMETVAIDEGDNGQYELVFHTAVYFAAQPQMPEAGQIMDQVVVRIRVPDVNGRIHIPLVLSPHSYTIWWSA